MIFTGITILNHKSDCYTYWYLKIHYVYNIMYSKQILIAEIVLQLYFDITSYYKRKNRLDFGFKQCFQIMQFKLEIESKIDSWDFKLIYTNLTNIYHWSFVQIKRFCQNVMYILIFRLTNLRAHVQHMPKILQSNETNIYCMFTGYVLIKVIQLWQKVSK